MQPARPPAVSDDSEEARAFLQARITLFWKVMFFITLFATGLGAIGAVAQRGKRLLAHTGRRRAVRCLLVAIRARPTHDHLFTSDGNGWTRPLRRQRCHGGALSARGGTRDHALEQPSAIMMADAYVAMLQLFGTGLAAVICAALIPSQPRRTLVLTLMFGVPAIVVTTFSLPTASGSLGADARDGIG